MLWQAADCLEEAIAGRIAHGRGSRRRPERRGANGWFPYRRRWLRKPPFIWRWESVGTTNLQLARELGCDEKEVWRMLNPRHPTKLPRIKEALDVLRLRKRPDPCGHTSGPAGHTMGFRLPVTRA